MHRFRGSAMATVGRSGYSITNVFGNNLQMDILISCYEISAPARKEDKETSSAPEISERKRELYIGKAFNPERYSCRILSLFWCVEFALPFMFYFQVTLIPKANCAPHFIFLQKTA